MNEIPELFDVIQTLRDDAHGLWRRIRAMEGDRFTLRFCCNSERVQRARMDYAPRGLLKPTGEQAENMPREAAAIIEACQVEGKLRKIVSAFSRGKFDLIFVCENFTVRSWELQEVS